MVKILTTNAASVLPYVNTVLLEVIAVRFAFINKPRSMRRFVFSPPGGFLHTESVWLNKPKYERVIFKRKISRFENIKNGFSVPYAFSNMCTFSKPNKIQEKWKIMFICY